MSYRKFGPNDVVLNTMRAHPRVNFFIYNSKVYHNDTPHLSGAFSNDILNVSGIVSGAFNLFEYNIDRSGSTAVNDDESVTTTGPNPPIVPYITKDSARASFKAVGATTYNNEFAYGDTLYRAYPLTASITREFMSPRAGQRAHLIDTESGEVTLNAGAPAYPHFYSLKNRLNNYQYMSEHYAISSSFNDGWDKNDQKVNMISIPSIFYGSKIDPGSVSLKWYFTGSLIGELRDSKENGELVEITGTNTGSTAGVVLYNEGIILLTGSWALNPTALGLLDNGTIDRPSWIYFGAGTNDGVNPTSASPSFPTASFNMSFNGTTETQTYTMFARAGTGQANYSNNPTFLEYGQDQIETTGSQIYEENPIRKIKNTASSSFATQEADFKRQVYVSRIAIYDKNKNLIGVATLADPVLKEEQQDYTFKIKLDI